MVDSKEKLSPIIIVGAGVFGLSTAWELTQRGYSNVTVLDRFMPPVPDGSSVDLSRVIRVDYADEVYGKMAREALRGWKTEYSNHFHNSGFVMLADKKGHAYLEKSKEINEALGQRLDEFEDANDILDMYPDVKSKLDALKAVHNPQGGWADAAGAISQLATKCSKAGVSFITGARGTVASLLQSEGRATGVGLVEGPPLHAAQVIIATGAWTNRLLRVEHATSASGQPVGFIQLSEDEASSMRKMPVIINLSTGFFVFPPTPGSNILKIARHSYGFATNTAVKGEDRAVSSPKMANNANSGYLPGDADAALRHGLSQLVPDVANHPWMNRRLCWYSDTPEGDFIIDHHSELAGVFVATGGAGQ